MPTAPKVKFRNKSSARRVSDQEIDDRLAQGALISNTAMSHHQARRHPSFGAQVPFTRPKLARRVNAIPALTSAQSIEISNPGLDRSDESAIALNPQNPNNIVAGAATFDGTQFTNSAYVTMDGGNTWQTVTALTNTDEGAGLAFDDSGNCYYVTVHTG
jgi:hypothetical protein